MFWTKEPEPELIIPESSLLSSDPIPAEMSLSLTHDHDDLIHPHLDMHSPIHLTHPLALPSDITLSNDTSLYQDGILTPKEDNEELLSSDIRMGLGMSLGGMKVESDKSMIPTPEGMYRGWDSYIAFPSSERDPYNSIAHTQSNAKSSSPSLSPTLSPSLSLSLSDHNVSSHTTHSLSQQNMMQGNTIFDSMSDKSPLRNGSVVWDAWKYGNGETQKSHQLP